MSRVTLQAIAEETGFSKFAVSRALSGKAGVSEATRERVRQAAAALGYTKPGAAVVKPLGVVFDDTDIINSELHMQIQSGAQRQALRMGYPLRITWTHHPDELETFARDSAGLLAVGPHGTESLERAYATGIPIVRVGWLDPLEPVDLVSGTDHEAGSAVADYLVRLGHREIVYVQGTPGYRGRLERLYGMREVLERTPGTKLHNLVWDHTDSFTLQLRRLQPDGVTATAFFCAHDGLAVTVVSELLGLGYRIPDDISVVGFGDFSSALQILPQLTTVKTPGVDMGAMCVRLLLDRIRNPDVPTHAMRIQIPNPFIERDSTGPAPRRSGHDAPPLRVRMENQGVDAVNPPVRKTSPDGPSGL